MSFEIDHLNDGDADTDEARAVAMKTPKRPSAADALADIVLDAGLTRATRAMLKRTSSVIIIRTPAVAWSGMLNAAIRRHNPGASISRATEREKSGRVSRQVGADSLGMLNMGRAVVYVCHDPDDLLEEAVHVAADATITLPSLSVSYLEQAIRRVTGGIARGVTAEMAALDLNVILTALRPGLSARECVANLTRALNRQLSPAPKPSFVVPLLSDLPLTASVRAWSEQVHVDLDAVKLGKLQPNALVHAVLEGPPGCGKTLLAESLARSSGWSFVPSSVGAWFTSGGGALGDVSRNAKKFFDEVLENAPAIGFLDELDALPDRATLDTRAREWWTSIITLILTEIDRVARSGKKVLLVGATNYLTRLDAALIRPGRLQQRVSVQPPGTDAELLALLRYHLGSDLDEADLDKLVPLARGATPAMVEGWTREARTRARAQDRSDLAFADMLEQVAPPDLRAPGDIRTVAIHEAGHALVALRLGHRIMSVSMIPDGAAGGATVTAVPTLFPTWQETLDLTAVSLGGRAADMVFGNGPNAGAEHDLAMATQRLLDALERQGLGKSLVAVSAKSVRPVALLDTVNSELQRALARAIGLLEAERERFPHLVDRLMQAKVLSGEEVLKILGPPPNPKRGQGGPKAGLTSSVETAELRRGHP